MNENYVKKAVELVGKSNAAKACKVDPRAVRRWVERGRLPSTSHSGENDYASTIAALCKRKVTKRQLLSLDYWEKYQKPIENDMAAARAKDRAKGKAA